MGNVKNDCRALVCAALNQLIKSRNPDAAEISAESVAAQTPPDPAMGDIGLPMFAFAKTLRESPAEIARDVVRILGGMSGGAAATSAAPAAAAQSGGGAASAASAISAALPPGEFFAAGPYVNVRLDKAAAAAAVLARIREQGESYGSFDGSGRRPLEGRRVMVEYSSPNTNKPLHLGHMRNDALGESVSRILKAAGAEVCKVNIINDRGVHICKSMLAYRLFHEAKGETPETAGMKGDHFVGQCYVEFDRYAKEHPEALNQAEEMLVKWESGDPEIRALWKRMNGWAVGGIKATYERTGVSFDRLYYESETYLKGREEIEKGLSRGVFFRAPDGSVRVDISEAVGGGNDGRGHEKVLLRKDGTSVYITQDIGTAVSRHNDWPFNQLVYVVASEQIYHFKALFYILRRLGFDWADRLYHLSYGLVNLPNGRMKSREGTIVDADALIDRLHESALSEIRAKGRDKELSDPDGVAEKIALAALHYYLLQVAPVKDMLFNPEESLSFTGNTGPYLQYMGARIASILRKAADGNDGSGNDGSGNDGSGNGADCAADADVSLLTAPEEWELIKCLGEFPARIEKAADSLDPSEITGYLYEASRLFSRFYQQCPILAAERPELRRARLYLAECTLTVMKNAMRIVLVPYLPAM